jgi:hypothetical protein
MPSVSSLDSGVDDALAHVVERVAPGVRAASSPTAAIMALGTRSVFQAAATPETAGDPSTLTVRRAAPRQTARAVPAQQGIGL